MNLSQLFDHPQALPSAPGVVQKLIASFADEDVSTNDIARTIAADQVLSAKLLRLANSAHYHVSRTIGSVDHAVTMLGFVTVRTLVISSGLTGSFKAVPGFDLGYFWRYSLHTAVVAKWLARKVHENQDLAFTVGLMHAIGQLVMHTAMPEDCRALDQEASVWDDRRLEAERAAFGFSHIDASAELAQRWSFPDTFTRAIRDFPHPENAAPANPTACIVHLAAWFARAQKNALSIEDMQARFPVQVGALLGLDFDGINEEMPSLDELSEGLDILITG